MKRLLLPGALVAVLAGAALATPSSGTSSTPLGRGTLRDQVKVKVDGIELEVEKPADVVTQAVTFQPGGTSGWHTHPGPVVVTVKSGGFVVYDQDCTRRSYGAGDVFVEEPGGPVLVRNETGGVSEALATFLVPSGAVLRGDAPAPEGCPLS